MNYDVIMNTMYATYRITLPIIENSPSFTTQCPYYRKQIQYTTNQIILKTNEIEK